MLKKIILGVLLFGSSSVFAHDITLATTTWEPYVSSSKDFKGYSYTIVAEAFKAAGYHVTVKTMPWQDAVSALEKGQVDGVFPEYYSAERAQTSDFSHAFSGGPIALYKRQNNPAEFPVENPTENLVDTFNRMSDATFGVVQGYTNLPAVDDNLRLHKVAAANDKANLEQLYQGKVQFAIIDKYVADYLLNHSLPESYAKQITFMPPILGYKLFYVSVSKKNPQGKEIIQAFNHGLDIIKTNGQMARILDQDAKETGSQVA